MYLYFEYIWEWTIVREIVAGNMNGSCLNQVSLLGYIDPKKKKGKKSAIARIL